ncbi:histocompatibility antigen 60b-like isoform X1 [Rattus norvegicus]|uniref:Histocompatibility 60b like 1 n=1 Tax=Rattus norvegicus TaxID=10116 RepID=A0A8I6GGC1_RAT|nr:histocompatibility antigen 60b-like isoform X1 [Rattus norvegicus]
MAKGATSKCNHSLTLSLLVLLNSLGTMQVDGTDSLSCNFTVQYKVSLGQCSVNGMTVLCFDDVRQNSPVCKTEKKGNATKLCNDLNQCLSYSFYEMMKLESGLFESKGNHTLRVTVQSQYNQGEFMDGCWAFMIDRQYPFYFYPKNMTWRENQPNAIKTMSQWENNRELFQSLKFLSTGDFSLCLKKLLTDSRELTRSTIKAPDTTQPTSTTQSPSTGNSTPAMSSNQSPSTGNSTQPTSTTDYLIVFEFTAIFLALIVVSMEKKKVLPAAPLPLQYELQSPSPAVLEES